jgi:hypothetical protein
MAAGRPALGTGRRSRLLLGALAVVALAVVIGVGDRPGIAGATGASCVVSAPQGVPVSSTSGSFPFFVSCSSLVANTSAVLFKVSNGTTVIEVRATVDAGNITSTGWAGGAFFVRATADTLPYFGQGECLNGAVNGSLYGFGTFAQYGTCLDTSVFSGNSGAGWFGDVQVASPADTAILVETKTLVVGGTVGTDVEEYTGTGFTVAACNAGHTCGTASFVSLNGDDTSPLNTWFPTSAYIEGFMAAGTGFVVGIGFALARSALN